MGYCFRYISNDYIYRCIVSAIEWVIDNKEKYNTKILNLSLGTPANNHVNSDPLVRAVNEALKAGIAVVVAAGNSGPNSQTILSPGNSPNAITVGAVDDRKSTAKDNYSIAPFSSRGPTKEGLRKPDVVAPGVSIKSLSTDGGYKNLSGTSMATPVVAGSLALLLSKDSNLRPKDLKREIMSSCTSLGEKVDNQGAGIINLNRLFDISSDTYNNDSNKSKPNRTRRSIRKKQDPKDYLIPDSNSEAEDYAVNNQSYLTDGLIFLLFLILILIRII